MSRVLVPPRSHTIVQPDMVYLDDARRGAISRRGIEGAPTHGVPFYWLVDPERRAIEALVLGRAGYSLAVQASGDHPFGLPPFPDPTLIPAALWP